MAESRECMEPADDAELTSLKVGDTEREPEPAGRRPAARHSPVSRPTHTASESHTAPRRHGDTASRSRSDGHPEARHTAHWPRRRSQAAKLVNSRHGHHTGPPTEAQGRSQHRRNTYCSTRLSKTYTYSLRALSVPVPISHRHSRNHSMLECMEWRGLATEKHGHRS